uniref:Orotidine-5'-phosphate decarboxylase n=1 Tax=uncultured Flavobacteriia bacterium TaxID=212695 RepID=H6RG25_9BACT|nr:orotidine 5'-phosphate decarboxylase [uncultured bacterium]CCF99986.1 orotidine 5'-phosphate decarboxylase [uncultured Flavobacteriia bacterium]
MTQKQLFDQIQLKKSFLCLGLDPDLEKMPSHLVSSSEDPLFDFCKTIVDNVQHLCVAVKINTAFFEAYGVNGYQSLERLIRYIKSHYPALFAIADAKRGDIGNTSLRYAKAFYEALPFDAITIAPYMGKDSVEPFLSYEDKYAILLALTSNTGANDFQSPNDGALYKSVLSTSKTWKHAERLMYVVGATKATHLQTIRTLIPDSFLLVPGVGAQGGSLEEVFNYGANDQVGLLVNSSRGILYASNNEDYAEAAVQAARVLQQQMEKLLR